MVAYPLVFDVLTAGAEAGGALPCCIVAMTDGQRGGACTLGFAGEAAVAIVTVSDAAVVIG